MSDCATIHINQLEEKKGVLVGTKSKYMIHGYNKSIPFLIKRGNAYWIQEIINGISDKSTILNKDYLLNLKFTI